MAALPTTVGHPVSQSLPVRSAVKESTLGKRPLPSSTVASESAPQGGGLGKRPAYFAIESTNSEHRGPSRQDSTQQLFPLQPVRQQAAPPVNRSTPVTLAHLSEATDSDLPSHSTQQLLPPEPVRQHAARFEDHSTPASLDRLKEPAHGDGPSLSLG